MTGVQNALNIVLPMVYALAWADYALLFFRSDPFAQKTAPILLRLAIAIHLFYLTVRGFHYNHFPVATVFEAFSVLALTVTVIYVVVESRQRVHTTGFFILGIVLAFQTASSIFIRPSEIASELLSEPIFVLHVVTALVGYCGMAISAVYGLLYIMLFHDIKRSRFGLIYEQLPALDVMAGFTYRAAGLGWISLSVAMMSGLALLVSVYGSYWNWDAKLMVTFAVWLIYGICAGASKIWGWSARRIAITSIAGFGVVLFSFLIVNFLLTSFHGFI